VLETIAIIGVVVGVVLMKIDVSEIRKAKGRSEDFAGSEPDFLLDQQGIPISFHHIVVSGHALNTGKSVLVQGKISAKVDLQCSRSSI